MGLDKMRSVAIMEYSHVQSSEDGHRRTYRSDQYLRQYARPKRRVQEGQIYRYNVHHNTNTPYYLKDVARDN